MSVARFNTHSRAKTVQLTQELAHVFDTTHELTLRHGAWFCATPRVCSGVASGAQGSVGTLHTGVVCAPPCPHRVCCPPPRAEMTKDSDRIAAARVAYASGSAQDSRAAHAKNLGLPMMTSGAEAPSVICEAGHGVVEGTISKCIMYSAIDGGYSGGGVRAVSGGARSFP